MSHKGDYKVALHKIPRPDKDQMEFKTEIFWWVQFDFS